VTELLSIGAEKLQQYLSEQQDNLLELVKLTRNEMSAIDRGTLSVLIIM